MGQAVAQFPALVLTGARRAIDPRTGAIKWKFKVPKQIFSTPAVSAGVVYFHFRDYQIYALAATRMLSWTGSSEWRRICR